MTQTTLASTHPFLFGDGITAITGTVGQTLDPTSIGSELITTGNLITYGDTQLIGGHMITGGIIFLLLLIARMLDQHFNRNLDCLELDNQEKDLQELE